MAALVPLLLGKREAYKRKVIPGLIKHKEENSQGCLVIHPCLPVILGLQNVDLLFQGKGVGLPSPKVVDCYRKCIPAQDIPFWSILELRSTTAELDTKFCVIFNGKDNALQL